MHLSHIFSYSENMSCKNHVTRDNNVLDVFAGVVCDADMDFDGLPMVVNLKTGCSVREGTINISSINNNVVEVIFPALRSFR